MTGTRFGALAILVVAVLLVGQTYTYTAAQLAMGPGDSALIALKRGHNPSIADIREAVATRAAALDWHESAQPLDDSAALHFELTLRDDLPKITRDAMLDRSITLHRTALALGPARPYSWLRLAQAHYLRDPSDATILPLLGMSYRIAPAEPRLGLQRLKLVYALRGRVDDDILEMVSRDVRLAVAYRGGLVAEFARLRFAFPWLRQRLRGYPEREAELVREFLLLPPP